MILRESILPDKNCPKCPRLRTHILENRKKFPEWHNEPVNSIGSINSQILIVGLAPGLKGANRTGLPFTGDHAGELLYNTLLSFDLAEGIYKPNSKDTLKLKNCRITNAVRCLPPKNKPIGSEVKNCAQFLMSEIRAMENLDVILALGGLAHAAVLTVLNKRKSLHKFGHNVFHQLDNLILANSYHCSRYNTNTGRLTEKMFHEVFDKILNHLK
jgi:uracil-DNA glycosylase family 4